MIKLWLIGAPVLLLAILQQANSCGYPGAPAHATVTFSSEDIVPGTVATHSCERGFELLGPARRICSGNGTWIPIGIPFCVLNVAAGKAPMQSTVAGQGIPQKAVDGSTSTAYSTDTCSLTGKSKKPWWYVNLLEPYKIQLVRVDFGKSCCRNNTPARVVVRVGNSRPDLSTNEVCNVYEGYIEEGRPLFLPCNPPKPGTFVSVTLETPTDQQMSICETFVYTDQAIPIERCPSFRDQAPGSTAVYNGKCYIFYSNQRKSFEGAKNFCEQRGGSLVDETSPSLQGFLSWELWRRHKSDPNAMFWMGAYKNKKDVWYWINGEEVGVSFWNLPQGNDSCSRFDGTNGWMWSDTNCLRRLNFICHHKPKTCGKPEQPTNSTLLARNYDIGSKVEYRCSPGHVLAGPRTRTCLPEGVYSDFTPKCKYLECPIPYPVTNGEYRLMNGTMTYGSVVQYRCIEGYVLKGEETLKCDLREKWNGPPPRCEPVYCPRPLSMRHGSFRLSRNSTIAGTIVEYRCNHGYNLIGKPQIMCLSKGTWDSTPPICRKVPTTTPRPTTRRPVRPPTIPPVRKIVPPRRKTPTRVPEVIITTKRPLPRPTIRRPIPSKRPEFPYVTKRTRKPIAPEVPDLQSEGSKEVPIVTRYPSEVDNEIPNDARGGYASGTNLPENSVGEVSSRSKKTTKLNLGGIIALGVFGGFVFLAAIITIIVILVRRTRNKKHSKGSHDNTTIITYDSSSDNSRNGGLNKYYRRAWENLRYDNKAYPHEEKARSATISRFDHGARRQGFGEGYREANEIMVSDVAALYSRPDRRQSRTNNAGHESHRHHGHAKNHRRSLSHGSASHLDDMEIQAWYNKQMGSQSRRSVY